MIFFALLLSLLAQSSHAVTLVHSNDVLGEIEPCGCRTNPLGGYARKSNFLKSLAKTPGGGQLIQLDAGDVLFPSDSMPEVLKKQSLIQARWVLKILDLQHEDAIVPGEKDFALGVPAFEKLIRGAKVRFLAANLRKKGGARFLEPSLILARRRADGAPLRVAVLGLVGGDASWPESLEVSDPIETAKKLIPSLRKNADFVIALTHEGFDADKKLAESVPGIDVIIGGHTQSFLQIPPKVGSTVIYQSSFRNQYVGVLDLSSFPNEESYKLVGLDAGFDSPADTQTSVDQATKAFKAEIAELNSGDMSAPVVKMEHTLFQTFVRCAECHLKQFDFWRKTPHAMALAPLVKAGQEKNKECLQCHTVAMGDPKGWSDVGKLVELNTDSETPEYIPASRFVDIMASIHDAKSIAEPVRGLSSKQSSPLLIHQSLSRINRAWIPVQCENCHGAGENHPISGTLPKIVENRVCLSCHTPERAPSWYTTGGKPNLEVIRGKRALISCPAGQMSIPE